MFGLMAVLGFPVDLVLIVLTAAFKVTTGLSVSTDTLVFLLKREKTCDFMWDYEGLFDGDLSQS